MELSERMGKHDGFPKSWTAEVKKMERDSDDKDGKIAEYLEVIDSLAKIVEEYEDAQAICKAGLAATSA